MGGEGFRPDCDVNAEILLQWDARRAMIAAVISEESCCKRSTPMFGSRLAGKFFIAATLCWLACVDSGFAKDKPKKPAEPELFANRSGAKREAALRDFGGTEKSEEAIALGLKGLVRRQQ